MDYHPRVSSYSDFITHCLFNCLTQGPGRASICETMGTTVLNDPGTGGSLSVISSKLASKTRAKIKQGSCGHALSSALQECFVLWQMMTSH